MEQPTGRTKLNEAEKSIIRQYRLQGYSYEQVARFTKRSVSSVKRVINGRS